jgi:hypothetical protein
MRPGCIGVITLICVTATTALGGDDDLDLPGLDAADLRGDAMVWEDANIYIEPWDGGASIKFNYVSRRRDEPGRAMPVRIIDSTMRNFVEIVAPGRADCSWRKIDVENRIEGLRMFVRRSDLAPVLVKPWTMQYSDGTKIKLGVGMPLTPTSGGEYLVGLRADKIKLPIPHGSVGYIYKAGKITDPELPKDKVVRIERGTTVKFGDEAFQVSRSNWYAPIPDKKTDVALVKLSMRCAELVASVPATSMRQMEPPRMYPGNPGTQPTPSGWRIPAGAPLMTATGREVAVAAKDISVQMPSPAPDTVCFEARVSMVREDETYGTAYRTIRLCASGSVVEK